MIASPQKRMYSSSSNSSSSAIVKLDADKVQRQCSHISVADRLTVKDACEYHYMCGYSQTSPEQGLPFQSGQQSQDW